MAPRSFRNLALVVTLGAAATALADERRFTYVYEPDVLEDGAWELEQWLTLRSGHEEGRFRVLDFRTEVEYGITEDLTTALYVNGAYEDVEEDGESEKEFEFEGISSEWKYRFTSPIADALGTMVYLELSVGEHELELEEKFIFGKHYESFVWSANVGLEQEREEEDEEVEKEAILEITAGAAYIFSPHWSAGVELRNHRAFPGDYFDFSDEESHAWFLGPNLHYGGDRFWATLTVLPQLALGGGLDLEHHERIEVRAIAGVSF